MLYQCLGIQSTKPRVSGGFCTGNRNDRLGMIYFTCGHLVSEGKIVDEEPYGYRVPKNPIQLDVSSTYSSLWSFGHNHTGPKTFGRV